MAEKLEARAWTKDTGAGKVVRLDFDANADPELLQGSSDTSRKWRRQLLTEYGASELTVTSGRRPPVGWHSLDADSLLTPSGLSETIARENKTGFDLAVQQLRSPMGIVPFVGAGLSVPFGFPSWEMFLRQAARSHSNPTKVGALLDGKEFIAAAEMLNNENPDHFQALVASEFGREVSPEQASQGAVSTLPWLATGPVITTNFDRVLEAAFAGAKKPFLHVITGPQPDNLIRAMHRNERALIKLHGDASDRSARVFTGAEYDEQYKSKAVRQRGKSGQRADQRATVSQLARILFTNRPLLFLGSSLEKDRTLEVLETLHDETPGLTHYAVLAASYRASALSKRRIELGRFGIIPLWFPPGEFAQIEAIIRNLVQEASTRLVWRPAAGMAPKRSSAPPTATVAARAKAGAKAPKHLDRSLDLIARRIAANNTVFLLGAGAHLIPNANSIPYWSRLGKDYQLDGSWGAAVAQHMIDVDGREQAWAEARRKLDLEEVAPSSVFQFLARLPGLFRSLQIADPWLWILTTNYDATCEKVFDQAGEPYHLLYYQADGPHEGLFYHRDPSNTVRLVERPQNILSLERAHVLVKLDGGIPACQHFRESVAISPMDQAVAAGRLPAALPAAVVQELGRRDLLSLGSSLHAIHLQRLVRYAAAQSDRVKTRAVVLNPHPEWVKYWDAAKVHIVDSDLTDFVPALDQRLRSMLGRTFKPAGAAPKTVVP
ncbi:MAG: SIR2 family protein [Bryobacteraceae bacterium]